MTHGFGDMVSVAHGDPRSPPAAVEDLGFINRFRFAAMPWLSRSLRAEVLSWLLQDLG